MAKRILLIDDEELVIKSVSRVLGKEGYETVICRNGEDAVEKTAAEDFDLVVCDVRMPKMNGIETIKKIREIRAASRRRVIPEIFITGFAEAAAEQEAETLKVADYIYKPFDLRDFLACVKKHLGV